MFGRFGFGKLSLGNVSVLLFCLFSNSNIAISRVSGGSLLPKIATKDNTRLHRLQNLKCPLGRPKMADRVWKCVNTYVFGLSCQLSQYMFLIRALIL